MKLLWKVCGNREPANMREVAGLCPDMMGFIFYPASPRYVAPKTTLPLLPTDTKKVGVFVNESPDTILSLVHKFGLDYVQLHGDETPADCETLKAEVDIIKVFRIHDAFDFSITVPYESFSDYFLFDTWGRGYGGTGKQFDWKLLQAYHQRVPFFLSGGIGVEHLTQLGQLSDMNVCGIDINSAVEMAPGVKDMDKLRIFKERFDRVRAWDNKTNVK